ncbi:hypothetical protein [Janibacter sp. LM]|uniref:hypothetical protein n=1 Tax=Janibacter sp. LM TaxID=3144845 RepID=UPI0031F6F09C
MEGAAHETIHQPLPSRRPEVPEVERGVVAVAGEQDTRCAALPRHGNRPAT